MAKTQAYYPNMGHPSMFHQNEKALEVKLDLKFDVQMEERI